MELEQLTEAEEGVVGTTLQDKFLQDARRWILHAYNLNQHQNNTHLPIFPHKSEHST
jgi:hypothetical protein